MKQSQAWKDLERTAARKLNGKRITRGEDFSTHALDVEHPNFAIDAKYRSKLAVLRWYEKLVKDSHDLYPDQEKIPILILKERNQRGELILMSLDDFIKICDKGVINGRERSFES